MKWYEWIFIIWLVYILVSNFKGTSTITTDLLKGAPPVIQSIQGVGPGYPPPARREGSRGTVHRKP